MHDPMVVAFEIRRPWPTRSSMHRPGGQRPFEWKRHGPWWRPASWSPFMRAFGREWYWPSLVTIWHVEPKGRDSGTVCPHYRRWKDEAGAWQSRVLRGWRWHVWHWRIQIHLVREVKRFLFERCIECGQRFPWGYSPVSHQWEGPTTRWFRMNHRSYHHQCSSLVFLKRGHDQDEKLIRHLFAAYRLGADLAERDALALLTDPKTRGPLEFHEASRLTRLLGYERDDDYELVKIDAEASI